MTASYAQVRAGDGLRVGAMRHLHVTLVTNGDQVALLFGAPSFIQASNVSIFS